MIDQLQVLDGTPSAGPIGTSPTTGAAITASRSSTNVLDMLAAADIGAGNDIAIHFSVIVPFVGAGATLQIELQTSPDNATFVGISDSPVMAVANLVKGASIWRTLIPANGLNDTGTPNRYYRAYYNVAGGPFTAGSIFCYLTAAEDRQVFNAYRSGYSIDA